VNGQAANSTQASITWIWNPTGAEAISPVSGWA
jgi:hypothetical protein